MRTRLLFASLLASGAAFAQTAVKPMIMKTPNEYYIVAASPNGKWACGVYADYSDERYGFLWNLESGEIELLNAAYPSLAYSVSNDGVVAGVYTDHTYRSNGAAVSLAGYWKDHKWNRLEMPDNAVNEAGAASISPDGHYITGHITKGSTYYGYVWKDGKIYRELKNNKGIAMPYTISPDGQYAAGWVQDDNRMACIWDATGSYTKISNYESPWSSGRKFSSDGKKLLFFDGWSEVDGKWGINAIYDVATGEKTPVFPLNEENFDFMDMSDKGTVVGENGRGYIWQDNKAYYADEYLMAKGIDLASEHVFMMPETDYYQIYRTSTVSADDNVMGFQYYNDDKDDQGEYSTSVQSMIVKFNQPTTGLRPASISASQLSGLSSVLVSWKPNTAAQGITGYNVYRDGKKLNTEPVGDLSYVDANLPTGDYKYTVTALYGDSESEKSEEVTQTVKELSLSTPEGLFAQQHGYNNAYVEWSEPYTNFSSLTYLNRNDADIETFGLSMTGYSYETAIYFDKTKTSAYKGQKITSVGFYPLEEQGGWKINIYTYDNSGKLKRLYSQPVTQELNYGARNVVKLDTPLDIPDGDLLIATEVAVTKASQSINALDYGRAVEGYSDLLRLTVEDDFYSIGQLMQTENYLYPATWIIDATVAPDNADFGKDNIDHYNVYADNTLSGKSKATDYVINNLAAGSHTIGISTVYADGSESPVSTTSVDITPNESMLGSVEKVNIEKQSDSSFSAEWEQPVSSDNVNVQYCSEEASEQSVTAPASNNYGIMASAIYPSKTFRGRDGYTINAVRFYPKADATFTAYIYKNNEMISQTDIYDYTLNQWNEVALETPIEVDSKASYQLVIDCYDVTPNGTAIAVDNTPSVSGYSDVYSLDGSSWNPLSYNAIYANWMIGLCIENTKASDNAVTGYDINIDGTKRNSAPVTTTSYSYDFGEADTKEHTIQVNTYYSVKPTSVEGGVTRFQLNTAGIDSNTVSRFELLKGDNVLTVNGENVKNVEIIAANGISVASADGNTVSLNGIAAGSYVVKANVAGKTVTRKIMINK